MKIILHKFMVALTLLLVLAPFSQLEAKVETHNFSSPEMEANYKILISELRCLVCQNQNLADSNAELAQDMRSKVFTMLEEGKTKDEIVEYMVVRYGDFVMYRPPVKSTTFLLWFGPLIFFVIAAFIVASFIRRQNSGKDIVIDAQQQQKAHSLLDEE